MPADHARRLDRFSQMGMAAGRLALDDARFVPGRARDGQRRADRDLPRLGARRHRLRRGAARALPREGHPRRSPRTSPSPCSAARRRPISASRWTSAGRSCRRPTPAPRGRSRSGRRSATCARAGWMRPSPAAARSRCRRWRSARSTSSGRCRPGTTTTPADAARPFDAERDGFVMGEGAALLVLEDAVTAERRGARPYAELLGYGATSDAHHMVQPRADGREAARAATIALADAGVEPDGHRLRQRPRVIDADRRRGRGAGDRARRSVSAPRPSRSAAPRRCTATRWGRPARSRRPSPR